MKIAPYGSWKSPITSHLIVAQSIGLAEIGLTAATFTGSNRVRMKRGAASS